MCDVSTAWLITAFVVGAICGIMIMIGFLLAVILRLARRSVD
jgi:nitrate reductase gamma subunit